MVLAIDETQLKRDIHELEDTAEGIFQNVSLSDWRSIDGKYERG